MRAGGANVRWEGALTAIGPSFPARKWVLKSSVFQCTLPPPTPTPELAAPKHAPKAKRPAKPYVYVQPKMETAAVKKSITVVEESESHTGKHNRGIIRPCMLCCVGRGRCAASDAPESGWLQLASGSTVGSTLEKLLPCHACEYRPGTHLSHPWAS